MTTITLPRNLEEYYQKGLAALEKNNYDYAIELLLDVVQEEPMHAPARKALRQAERLLAEESQHSFFTIALLKLNSLLPLILALFYEASRNTKKALAFYEEALRHFPTDTSLLTKVTNLALKENWTPVALTGYEDLIAVSPQQVDYLSQAAALYKQLGEIEQAKQYYLRALEAEPNNQEIKKSLKDMDALTSIKEGNWDDNRSYRTKIAAASRQQEKQDTGSTAPQPAGAESARIAELLARTPDDEALRFQLAAALRNEGKLREAIRELNTLMEKSPFNTKYHDAFNEVSELYYITRTNELTKKLSFEPGNAAIAAEITQLEQKRHADATQLMRKKVELYPNDLALRFDLGSLLFAGGEYQEAIGQFQLAVKDPSRLTQSLNKLGLCFFKKGMYDLAVAQFEKALERESGITEITKDIIYNLGTTFEAMGKSDAAFEQYKKIYEVDITYRDIANKIDRHYKK